VIWIGNGSSVAPDPRTLQHAADRDLTSAIG
jgi:hypothetical protein